MRWFTKRSKKVRELDPDEIFLDASNVSELDRERFEGRLEKPLAASVFIGTGIIIALVTLGLVVKGFSLEVIHGETFAAKSERNRLRPEVIFAKRGALLDRNGVVLAANRVDEEKGMVREYKTPGFGHVIGYVSYPKKDSSGNYYDTEVTGLAGAEAAFNDTLAGKNGRLLIEEDARGAIQSQGIVEAPEDGKSVTLSIDARAQEAFYNSIHELADRIPFQGGAAVLMDIYSGEVRALVSYPEYDPNVLSHGEERDTIAGYTTNTRTPYLNRAIGGLYAPGSIVKTVVAAGALTDGVISPEKIIVSTGKLVIPNPYNPDQPTIFPDWKPLGPMNTRSALAWSSDVYFYTVGGGFGDQKGLGIDRLVHWYQSFGYGRATGIELPGENTGFIPTPTWKEDRLKEPWRIGNTYHTSIGQYAMQVTVIEAAQAVAAIANNGLLVKPTIIKDAPLVGESIVVSADALQVVREGMRQAVTEGTGSGLNTLSSFVKLGAKTGTAQVGANNEFTNAWLIGFFPYEKPKYAFAVLMDRGPGHNTIGGVYATIQALTKLHQTAPEYFE